MTATPHGPCTSANTAPSVAPCVDRRARCVRLPMWLTHCPDQWCDAPIYVELNPALDVRVTCLCGAVGKVSNIGVLGFTLELVSTGRFNLSHR